MKKIISKLFSVLIIIGALSLNSAFAAIKSESDVYSAIAKMQQIQSKDFISFINKSELIGNRLATFEMGAEQYKTNIIATKDKLQNILDRKKAIDDSGELSFADKQTQIKNLYHEADNILYDLDNKTITYVYNAGSYMPSITYSRYVKTFIGYYNSMNISGQKLTLK